MKLKFSQPILRAEGGTSKVDEESAARGGNRMVVKRKKRLTDIVEVERSSDQQDLSDENLEAYD